MRNALIVVLIALVVLGCSRVTAPGAEGEVGTPDIITEWTDETSCSTDSDCEAVEFGCGGNHTKCTSEPARYEGMISTCDIVENHPNEQGYVCGCNESKCVWEK